MGCGRGAGNASGIKYAFALSVSLGTRQSAEEQSRSATKRLNVYSPSPRFGAKRAIKLFWEELRLLPKDQKDVKSAKVLEAYYENDIKVTTAAKRLKSVIKAYGGSLWALSVACGRVKYGFISH